MQRRSWVGILALIIVSTLGVVNQAQSAGSPYPQSTLMSGVNWQFNTVVTSATGSDLWPATWAGDNNVYSMWGDGGGFGGDDTKCRTQLGMAKITGDPPSFTTSDVFGCKADGTGCAAGATHDVACNAGNASTLAYYVGDILAIDNTLYSTGWSKDPSIGTRISYSTDFGRTWTQNSWSSPRTSGSWIPGGFVQYGKGYSGAVDNYVYIVGTKTDDANHTYLARVPKTSINSQGSYQWFTGTPSVPTWGTWTSATPIHTDSNNGHGGQMTYFPVLGRYIFTQAHGGFVGVDDGLVGKLAIYESPNPWGPWTTIAYYENWGSYGTSTGLLYSIVTKWISADNKTFWMSFSGGSDGTVNMDAFHLIKGEFTLAIDGGTPSPSPPAGLIVQ